eukprot:8465623-Alexandrium_andersonii.AAC.1
MLARPGRAGLRLRMPARTPLARRRVGRFGRPATQHSPRTKSGGGMSAPVCLSARGAFAVFAGACRMPRAPVSSRALARCP